MTNNNPSAKTFRTTKQNARQRAISFIPSCEFGPLLPVRYSEFYGRLI